MASRTKSSYRYQYYFQDFHFFKLATTILINHTLNFSMWYICRIRYIYHITNTRITDISIIPFSRASGTLLSQIKHSYPKGNTSKKRWRGDGRPLATNHSKIPNPKGVLFGFGCYETEKLLLSLNLSETMKDRVRLNVLYEITM